MENFFFNKSNIANIYTTVIKNNKITTLQNGKKEELLKAIANEMKNLNDTIDQNKIKNLIKLY